MAAEEKDILQIPCVVTKISSHPAGGWAVTMHIPEFSASSVRELVGLENKQSFIMVLVKDPDEAARYALTTKAKEPKKKGKDTCQKPGPIIQP